MQRSDDRRERIAQLVPEHREKFADAINLRTLYVVPLIARGRTIGALGALQAESGRPITDADRSLIGEIAQRAALAIDNARLFAEAEAALKEAETANRAKDEVNRT